MSYLVIGPAYRKMEANAKSEAKAKSYSQRLHACEVHYRRSRFRVVLALRRMYADTTKIRESAIWRSWLILEEIAATHGFTVAQLQGPSRKRLLAHARFEAAYRLRTERGASLQQIGKLLGGRDHTTVMHAIRSHAVMHQLPLPGGCR